MNVCITLCDSQKIKKMRLLLHVRPPDHAGLHSILNYAAMELVSVGCSCRQALSFVSKGKAAIRSMTVIASGDGVTAVPDGSSVQSSTIVTECDLGNVSAPPRVRSRGRPAQSRFMSPIESPGSRKRETSNNINELKARTEKLMLVSQPGQNLGKLVTPPAMKRRPLGCLEMLILSRVVLARGDRCQLCGEKGNYKSTRGEKGHYSHLLQDEIVFPAEVIMVISTF